MFRKTLAALLLSGSALTLPAQAANLSPEERSELHAEIRAYLLENPEVLIEAFEVLDSRRADAQQQSDSAMITDNQAAIFDDGYSWVGGNPEGDITLVEFMDYRCGYCRKAYQDVEKLIESDGNIRFVVKEFPILGPASDASARFAISALRSSGPDAYKAVHDALVQLKSEPTDNTLRGLAETLDLDADLILAGMNSPEVADDLARTQTLAQQLGISGTPAFIMGDQLVPGYVPLDGMRDLVANLRKTN